MQRKRAWSSKDPEEMNGVVKSAARVIQILEYFDDIQREATIVEISNQLDYPQSSTSALLKSLTRLGYLRNDPYRRTYIPSNRVTLLGHWVSPDVFSDGPLIRMMKDIAAFRGDAVVLATRKGIYSQYVHVIQATAPARLHMTVGSSRPLAKSGTGLALLSALPDPDVVRLVNRINAEARSDAEMVSRGAVMEVVAEARANGYAFCNNMITVGGATLSIVLPQSGENGPMVLSVAGIYEAMRRYQDELLEFIFAKLAIYRRDVDNTERAAEINGLEIAG